MIFKTLKYSLCCRYVAKQGFLDVTAHDYELVFGCEVQTGMDKAARLVYGDSLMTHAMVFTGCHEEDGPGECYQKGVMTNDKCHELCHNIIMTHIMTHAMVFNGCHEEYGPGECYQKGVMTNDKCHELCHNIIMTHIMTHAMVFTGCHEEDGPGQCYQIECHDKCHESFHDNIMTLFTGYKEESGFVRVLASSTVPVPIISTVS